MWSDKVNSETIDKLEDEVDFRKKNRVLVLAKFQDEVFIETGNETVSDMESALAPANEHWDLEV